MSKLPSDRNLEAKHRYKQEDGAVVHLFHINNQDRGHSVHFPYLASILAGLKEENRKLSWSISLSIAALIISIIAIIVNALSKWPPS